MPIPKPSKIEKKSDFIARCMGDNAMNKDYSDQKQRAGICYSQWENKKVKASYIVRAGEEEYMVSQEEVLAADKPLNKPFRTPSGPKKFSVYVKNDKGNIVKVNFGDPNMEIKRDNPERRSNFRARHRCENPGPKWKARYWSCRMWSSQPVSKVTKGSLESFVDHEEIIEWDKLPTDTEIQAMYPQIQDFKAVEEVTEET